MQFDAIGDLSTNYSPPTLPHISDNNYYESCVLIEREKIYEHSLKL
jgi:hypothetical protein